MLYCPNFFGMCCRSEWQERMYIYKWHEVDQTKHEIFCVHIVCNEIQVKVNLEITTFFFYLCFPYCNNFFWFGVVILKVLSCVISTWSHDNSYVFYVKCGSIKRTFTYVFTGTKTYNTDVFSASKRINTYVFSAFKRWKLTYYYI